MAHAHSERVRVRSSPDRVTIDTIRNKDSIYGVTKYNPCVRCARVYVCVHGARVRDGGRARVYVCVYVCVRCARACAPIRLKFYCERFSNLIVSVCGYNHGESVYLVVIPTSLTPFASLSKHIKPV